MADDEARARRTTRSDADGPVRKATVKKTAPAAAKKAAKKAVAKIASSTRATANAPKRATAKRTTSGTAAEPAAARKAAAAKGATSKAAAKGGAPPKVGAVLAGQEKQPPALRLAAEQTFDDDWDQPAPEPPREDPSARMRAVLRAAAASLEAKERSAAAAPEPAPASEEPVARVLVEPVAPEPEPELQPEADAEENRVEGRQEDDWSPPEVLEAPTQAPPPPPLATPPPHPAQEAAPTPAPPPPTPEAAPPTPAPPESAEPEKERRGGGPSIVAIVLAVVVPVVGAIVGFVLANRGRRRGAALAGVARVVSILALVAWLVGGGVLAFVALRGQGVDYSKLKVGDCFDSSATNEVRGVKVKPCSEPHNSEIFFLVTHPAGPDEPYPGKDQLVQFAADACLGQPLTEYLGVPLEQSKLKDFEIVPQESAWKDGRRVLVCGIDTGGEGRITGSVKGTRR